MATATFNKYNQFVSDLAAGVHNFTTDGTDGKLYYVTQAGDLMEKGTWKVCARVVTGTYSGTTSKITFYAKGAS